MVIEILRRQKPLTLLEFSAEGVKACRKVNDEMDQLEQPMCYTLRKTYLKLFGDPVLPPGINSFSGQLTSKSGGSNQAGDGAKRRVHALGGSNVINPSADHCNSASTDLPPPLSTTQNLPTISTAGDYQLKGTCDEPAYEYSEIGWEGSAEELALFILIGGCQCSGPEESMPLLDSKITKVAFSFRGHKSLKSSLQLLYLQPNAH